MKGIKNFIVLISLFSAGNLTAQLGNFSSIEVKNNYSYIDWGRTNTDFEFRIANDNGLISLTSVGRLHITGGEQLFLLNKSGVNISKAWGGNGNLNVDGNITLGALSNISGQGRLHISGTEHLFLLNQTGVSISKAWGGNGNLTVEGHLTMGAFSNITGLGRLHITGSELLYVLNKDGVVIGKEFGGSGNLMVQGTILTSRVKVAALNGANWSWADYVFDKNYKLRSLFEVEKFVLQNKHLPNVPSAAEVGKNGYDMAEMDSKLLEKIEELTLYLIQLKKDNEQLKAANQNLLIRLTKLETAVSK